MACRSMALVALHGMTRHSIACVASCAWHCVAWHCVAWLGVHGIVWRGIVCVAWRAWHCLACHGHKCSLRWRTDCAHKSTVDYKLSSGHAFIHAFMHTWMYGWMHEYTRFIFATRHVSRELIPHHTCMIILYKIFISSVHDLRTSSSLMVGDA